nr:hypothetical protein [Cupriavidus sp. L7L]
MAAMLATRKETARLCLRAGDRHVVVRLEDEEKFRVAQEQRAQQFSQVVGRPVNRIALCRAAESLQSD